MSVSTIGLSSDGYGAVDASRSGYLFKPFCGKQFSKSNNPLSPINSRSIDASSGHGRISSSSLVLSPLSLPFTNPAVHRSEPVGSTISLKSLEENHLQIGLPEEDSRLPSPNLQIPIFSMQQAQFKPTPSNFDDEGFLVSEFHSERESLAASGDNRQLDNPFSLDISEKPQSEIQNFNLHSTILNDQEENEIRSRNNSYDNTNVAENSKHGRQRSQKILQNSSLRLSKKHNFLSPSHSELNAHSTISTLGETNVAPFAVHKRVLGWKLTSLEKRRQLVDILDAVHGQKSPDLQLRLRKSKILESGVSGSFDASLNSQMAPFGATKSLPELKKSLASSTELFHSHSKHSFSSKTRETIAYEVFVARSVNSRQGFRTVQQIRNYVEEQKKQKESRDKIIALQKQKYDQSLRSDSQRAQIPLQQQNTSGEQEFFEIDGRVDKMNIHEHEISLTVRPYVPVGTLTAADKFGQSSDSATLQSLVTAALFEDDERNNVNMSLEIDQKKRESALATMNSAERLYNFPVNIYRPRNRMDILDSVKIRHDVEPSLGGTQWKEDQLVDAFIVGRQNARLRRSRNQSRQDNSHSNPRDIKSNSNDNQNNKKSNSTNNTSYIQPELSPSKDSLKMELLGDGWDNDSVLSMSTSAEENEAALSEALLENFGLSLRDNDLDEEVDFNDPIEIGSDFKSLSSSHISHLPEMVPSVSTINLNNSSIDSEIGTNHPLDAPSLHPPQPHSTGSTINNPQLDDDNSWVD